VAAALPPGVPLGAGDGEDEPGVDGGVVEGASEEEASEDDAGAERLHPAIGKPATQRRSKRTAIIL
jgi:hypothetical protein